MAKRILLIFILLYASKCMLGQGTITTNQQLDSMFKYMHEKVKTASLIACVVNYGKAGNEAMGRLDSLGLLNERKFNTALLLHLADTAIKYYVPIQNKCLKSSFLRKIRQHKRSKVLVRIKIFAQEKYVKNKPFFVITKMKILK